MGSTWGERETLAKSLAQEYFRPPPMIRAPPQPHGKESHLEMHTLMLIHHIEGHEARRGLLTGQILLQNHSLKRHPPHGNGRASVRLA